MSSKTPIGLSANVTPLRLHNDSADVGEPPNDNTTLGSTTTTSTTFTTDDFEILAKLTFNSEKPSADRVATIRDFFNNVGVENKSDLHFQNGKELFGLADDDAKAKFKGLHILRLQNLLDFLASPESKLSSSLSIGEVSQFLRKDTENKISNGNKTSVEKEETTLKYYLAEIPAFSGDTREFFPWITEVEVLFGQATIADALTDEKFAAKDPRASTAGFFAISKALKDGTMAHLHEDVKDKNNGATTAFDIYNALMDTFNTQEAKANFVCYAVDMMSEIRLDNTTTAEQFISDWKRVISILKRFGTDLTLGANGSSGTRDMVRAFLLRSIISDDFEQCRTYITKHPLASLDDYFTNIRSCNAQSLLIHKEPLTNDEGHPVSVSRRTVNQSKKNRSSLHKSPHDHPKWHIPFIPGGWKKVLPNGLGKHIERWRNTAHGTNITPEELERQFAVTKMRAAPSNKKWKKNRRASTTGNEEDFEEENEPATKKAKSSETYTITSAYPVACRVNGRKVKIHPTISQISENN